MNPDFQMAEQQVPTAIQFHEQQPPALNQYCAELFKEFSTAIQKEHRVLLQFIRDQAKNAIPTADSNVAAAPSSSKDPKIPDVDAFHGQGPKSEHFISELKIFFALQPHRFNSDEVKIQYAVSRLKDRALDWIFPYVSAGLSKSFAVWEKFEDAFLKYYGFGNRSGDSMTKLLNLKQGKQDFRQHLEHFRLLLHKSGLPESEDISRGILMESLSPFFQQALSMQARATTFSDLIEKCLMIEDYKQRLPSKSGSKFHEPNSFTPRPQISPPFRHPENHDPMEIDSITIPNRGRLTPRQKEFCYQNNICTYCRRKGHTIGSCNRRKSYRDPPGPSLSSNKSRTGNGNTQ